MLEYLPNAHNYYNRKIHLIGTPVAACITLQISKSKYVIIFNRKEMQNV
jgi:hypothetical protein